MTAVLFSNLLLAHLISDFWFQTQKMVSEKRFRGFKGSALWLHALVVALVSFLFAFDYRFWPVAVVILLSHCLIDYGKTFFSSLVWPFVVDQILHISILYLVSIFYIGIYPDWTQVGFISRDLWLVVPAIACAIVFCTSPANHLIHEILEEFRIDMRDRNESCQEAMPRLRNAGALIGAMERLLILLFVLIGNYEAAGLTVAAKSILRFRDDEGPRTEFVLVGTLLSFLIAVVVAVVLLATVFDFRNLKN